MEINNQINQLEKYEIYDKLMNYYVETIDNLINLAQQLKILPLKMLFGMNRIKKYINENRCELLENGLTYILANKETILNFNIKNLDELDEDSDDNTSIKSCVNNFKKNKNEIESSSDEMLNLIIEIKNKTKKLHNDDIEIIKNYFEILIMILEQIQNIFI